MAYNVKLSKEELSDYQLLTVFLGNKIASTDFSQKKNILQFSEITSVLMGISGLLLFNIAETIDSQDVYKQYLYDKATNQDLIQKYVLMMKSSNRN